MVNMSLYLNSVDDRWFQFISLVPPNSDHVMIYSEGCNYTICHMKLSASKFYVLLSIPKEMSSYDII